MRIKQLVVVFAKWHTATTFSGVEYVRVRPLKLWTPFCWRIEKLAASGWEGHSIKDIARTGWFKK